MKKAFKKYLSILKIILGAYVAFGLIYSTFYYYKKTNNDILKLQTDKINTSKDLLSLKNEITTLKSRDEYKINVSLEESLKNTETTYNQAIKVYEKLLDLKTISKNTSKLDASFADILSLLSKLYYSSAEAELATLSKQIDDQKQSLTTSLPTSQNAIETNTPPGSGYQAQTVKSDVGDFFVEIIAADLNSTKVIVDSASDSDCANNCPVLSLSDYVSRSGAYAGVNGSYFCPSNYPSCSGKTNSFDTLLMNKNKHYINSDNNVYSTVPAVIFSGNSARFVTQSLQWGRDTGVDSVIAMQPLLDLNGNITFDGGGAPKEGAKGSRSFIGTTGSTVYIGVVFNATVAESADVLHTMGIQNALNLDDGGSTALWYGGYKAGPGRNLPNVVLFVKK